MVWHSSMYCPPCMSQLLSQFKDPKLRITQICLSDESYFRLISRPATQLSDNWVIRFAALKRLYRLITQYFAEVLHQPSSSLDVPDLQAIAKDFQLEAILILCRLTICIAVQSEKNKEVIDRIQLLSETKQHVLMKAIEQVSCPLGFFGLITDQALGDVEVRNRGEW